MGKKVIKEEKNTVTIEVKYYENNSAKKKDEPLGVFNIEVTPREVKPVNTKLKGEALERDEQRFKDETDAADMALRTDALDKVHEIVGWSRCVLVANIKKEEEEK